MNRFALALGVAGLVAGLAIPARAQTTIDTLSCYKVNDTTPRSRFQASVRSANGGSAQACVLKTPARLGCTTTTSAVTPAPSGGTQGTPSGEFLCYQARCPGAATPGAQSVSDPFGSRSVNFRAARFVCIPASSAPVVTTTTVPGATTTSTTIQTGNSCTFSNGKCTGTCGAGLKCGTAVSSASCECRRVSCGDADAPECNGACSSSGEACIFSITGCSCVRVP